MPSNKALGPDLISDKWLRRKRNSLPLHSMTMHWVNTSFTPPVRVNDANLLLLSKLKNNSFPTIQKTRPIAMSTVLRKFFECSWLQLYAKALWNTIHPKQIGFRPGKLMTENTANLLKDIKSSEYKYAWFVDITQAFPSVSQPLMLHDIFHRQEIINRNQP